MFHSPCLKIMLSSSWLRSLFPSLAFISFPCLLLVPFPRLSPSPRSLPFPCLLCLISSFPCPPFFPPVSFPPACLLAWPLPPSLIHLSKTLASRTFLPVSLHAIGFCPPRKCLLSIPPSSPSPTSFSPSHSPFWSPTPGHRLSPSGAAVSFPGSLHSVGFCRPGSAVGEKS